VAIRFGFSLVCVRRHGLLALVVASWLGVAAAGVSAEPGGGTTAPARDGGVSTPAAATGRPVCVRTGTRSEGWAWPSGRFIHWAKCKGVVPKCQAAGPGAKAEGWYANGVLIAADHCSKSIRKHR
jgi:hypothetical protein